MKKLGIFMIFMIFLAGCNVDANSFVIKPAEETMNQKEKKAVHNDNILPHDEIRSVMIQYLEWYLTARKFMDAPGPTDNLTEYLDTNLSSFEESVSHLVTERFSKDNESFIRDNISTNGTLTNGPKFDVRFEVIENTPSKVIAKSVMMPKYFPETNETEFGSNVYLTAIKDNDKWYIDEISYSQAPEDPVNLTWSELESYDLEYLGEIDVRTIVGFHANSNDYTKEETKVYLVKNPSGEGIVGITAASGNIVKVPEESLPDDLRPPDTIVYEYSMDEDGTVSANFEHNSTIKLKVGQRLEIQRIDNLDRSQFNARMLVSAGPVEWETTGGNQVLIGVKAGVTELTIIPFSYEWDLAHVINIEVVE
ncbi:hypothetical protein [Sutcliffiella horikoshii]|uniref:hypothetical protein n=1 Tax=Sutcliffiella horikoshii TaxID=79883 RepID=UPI003CE9D3C7